MKGARLVAAGVGVYVVALALTAPATLFDAALAEATEGRLRIAQAQGTLWSGRGLLEIRSDDGRSALARRLAWRFLPRDLLAARVGYQLQLEPVSQPFPVRLSWTGIEIRDADIRLPAAALGHGVPGLASLGLSGELELRIASLSLGRDAARMDASVQWRNAASALSPVAPLGDYELALAGTGPEVRAVLRTLQGPLQLGGAGSWAHGSQPDFLATARVPPDLQPRLVPFLRLVAVEQADGSFVWRPR